MFREDSRANTQKARRALTEGGLQEVGRVAHTIKGMLNNLAMGRSAEVAAALEKAATEGRKQGAEKELERLEDLLEGILEKVEVQLVGAKA
jgi:HPt (histidine-containing phosphotransfer) domain-containing protein